MRVEPLFDIGIAHAFYEGGGGGDLMILPTAATAAFMRGHGLGARPFGDRLRVYRELDSAGAQRSPVDGTARLTFGLALGEPAFPSFTDMTPLAALSAPLFTNAGLPKGDAVTLTLTTREATATERLIPAATGEATFVLGGRPDPAADAAVMSAVSDAGSVTVRGYEPAARRVAFTGPGVIAGVPVAITYPVRPVPPPDMLAEIEIEIDQAEIDTRGTASRPIAFAVPFAARTARWCYYLVTQLTDSVGAFRIAVTGPPAETPGLAFGDAGRRDLTAQPDPGDPIGQGLVRRLPTRRVLRFLADTALPCRRRPVRGIELHADAARLFAALPNPSPASSSALIRADRRDDICYAVVTTVAE
jgi:hypothetical protein